MSLRPLALAGLMFGATALQAAHADVEVVTTIKPIHSLVASVMEGVGEPKLLMQGSESPHTFSMKPSHAKMLGGADAVFWVGPGIETFLSDKLDTVAPKAKHVTLSEAKGLKLLEFREGGAFEAHSHDHGDHGHDDDHGHGHDKEHAHHKEEKHHDHDHHDHGHDHKHDHDDHKEHAHHKEEKHHDHDHRDHGHDHKHDHDDHKEHAHHKEDKHHDHGHDGHEKDSHVWLDPHNAEIMTKSIAATLSSIDPENKATYMANADALVKSIEVLEGDISSKMKGLGDKGFIVFHDAYQYFEKRFGLNASGSITLSPEVVPGAKRLTELREKVTSGNVACIFSEPQFNPKIVETLAEGLPVKTAVLDPIGTQIEAGPDAYVQLITNMSQSFSNCLVK